MKTIKRLIILSAALLATAGVVGASAAGRSSPTGYVVFSGTGHVAGQQYHSFTPLMLPSSDYSAIAAGISHSLALHVDGRVFIWGSMLTESYKDPVPVSGLESMIAIAAGVNFSLALRADGTVWGWGLNDKGQLGDGTLQDQSKPVPVVGLANIVAIAAGLHHGLALDVFGKVWAWGYNGGGQLGDGSTNFGPTPGTPRVVRLGTLLNLDRVIAIAGGSNYSLALRADGKVLAWGSNNMGQLGNGSTNPQLRPVEVQNIVNAVAIAAGDRHNLALTAEGRVLAWGYNGNGQLGDGTLQDQSKPVQVRANSTQPLERITAIAAGSYHSLAIRADGHALAWGWNKAGQLGDGSNIDRQVPVTMMWLGSSPAHPDPVRRVAALAGANWYTLVIIHAGQSLGWGANDSKQLGNLTGDGGTVVSTENNCLPTVIAAGAAHSLGIGALPRTMTSSGVRSDWGMVCSWGANDQQQLGRGDSGGQPLLLGAVVSVIDAIGIAAGGRHSLALKSDGTVWAWGANDRGQVGLGAVTTSNVKPTQIKVKDLSGVKAVAAGDFHSLALKADGTVWAWGANDHGQVGKPDLIDRPAPVQVAGLADIVAVAAGGYHNLALRADGTVWAWGLNFKGQLGDPTVVDDHSATPVQVGQKGDFTGKAIAAGSGHSLALKADGQVWAWGWNNTGQLGDGSTSDRSIAKSVTLHDLVRAIAAGGTPTDGGHSLALGGKGAAWIWGLGWNTTGQLVPTPWGSQYGNTLGLTAIAAGSVHSLAIGFGCPMCEALNQP